MIDFESMRLANNWPTPNSMRIAANALDMLTIPKYGNILRWMADACDESIIPIMTTDDIKRRLRIT